MYEKRAFTVEEHIEQLKQRGLIIEEIDDVKHYLSNISYYRLAGYWWSMQSDKIEHKFKPNSTFGNVIALYNFDKELRLLVFDIIEKIEISLRTKLIYFLSLEHSPWWFENKDLFINKDDHNYTLSSIQTELNRSKDTFILEHYKKYIDDVRFPPAWKTLELVSFGALSKLYGNLKGSVKSKKTIARELKVVNHKYLPSWLQSINQIRNYCAHHNRLWNRNLPGKPKLLSKPPANWLNDVPKPEEFKHLYIHLCIMKYLLNVIEPDNNFTDRLKSLFIKYPNVDVNAIGMKKKWSKEPLWNNEK